jgi:hypothetical protein
MARVEINHCVDDDTVVLYHLSDLTDETSASNDLTNGGSTPFTGTGYDGEANGCPTLNGSSQYLSTTTLWSSANTNITLEAWFKTTDYTQSDQIVFTNGRGGGGAGNGYCVMISGNGTSDGSIYLLDHGVAWYDTGDNLGDNDWHHIALVLDSSGHPRIYLDSVDIYYGAAVTVGTPTQGSALGAENLNTRFFGGNIDEVQVTTRAKSATEISNYYQGTVSAKYYCADGGDGDIVSTNKTWATARAGSGLSADSADNDGNTYVDQGYNIRRCYFPFTTSTLPDSGITIDAASLWLHTPQANTGNADSLSMGLVESAQASATALATSDWAPSSWDRVSTDVTLADLIALNAGDPYEWVLNATGIAAIDTAGITTLMTAIDKDIDDTSAGITSSNYSDWYYNNEATVAYRPYLWVEYSASAAVESGATPTTLLTLGVG